MAIELTVQKDYLKTEASVKLPAKLVEVDELLKQTKTSGKLVVLYYKGSVQGINFEQNTKVPAGKSGEIRSLLDLEDKQV